MQRLVIAKFYIKILICTCILRNNFEIRFEFIRAFCKAQILIYVFALIYEFIYLISEICMQDLESCDFLLNYKMAIQRTSPNAYRMTNDNMQNSLLEKLHIDRSSGSEYAEPDYIRY